MAGLTPEEQAFFESGGDTSKLNLPDPGQQGVDSAASPAPAPSGDFRPVDLSGLADSAPIAPPAPTAAPATPVVNAPATPAPQDNTFLQDFVRQTQEQTAKLVEQIESLKAGQTPPEAPAPDPVTDPLGNLLHQIDKINKSVTELQRSQVEQRSQSEQMAAFNAFKAQVMTLRDEFIKTTPDFQDAYQHLRAARTADLRAFGLSDTDIQKTLFQEEFQLSQSAVKSLRNPAADMYEMAKRHGYVAKAAPTPTAAPASKLAVVKQGVETAPPNLPRTPVNEEITVESLREASDADLNKLVTDPAAWARIAGTSNIPI